MKIVHMADVHLGRFYKGKLTMDLASKRREELWQTFEKNIKYIRDNGVDVLLLCGDIYEREHFTSSDMDRFTFLLNTLKETEVFIIAGNHDYIDSNSLILNCNFNKNIHLFVEEDHFQINDLNLRVYGFSWDKGFDFSKDLKFELDSDFINILMLHGSTLSKEHFYLDKNVLNSLEFDYIALGHIHIRQKITDRAYYSGSPEPVSFKDMGDHGFIEIELKDELSVAFKGESLRNYIKHEVYINPSMDLYEVKEIIEDKLKYCQNDFNRIILKGRYDDIDYLVSFLEKNLNYFYFEIENNLKVSYDIEELLMKNKDNILGRFIECSKDDEKVLEYGIRALLEAKNEN
ncbi:putative Ser/Thr protein phosphatase family protein [Peptoniphilus sp. ING2-D1G]|nr:putative Ser/Thr protein phosphatase family protein [Peptoniphilus sp. ING2-D1G]